MGAFRRVEADRAGPEALGILVPPARRTFVILRPRSLAGDLLLCRSGNDLAFHAVSHDEASALAQALFRGLREGLASVETRPHGGSTCVVAHVGPYCLILCPRLAGQPYSPLLPSAEEAGAVVSALAGVLCPAGEQEVYFNTRYFERPPA